MAYTGTRIKNLRSSLDLTQAQLAEVVGVTSGTVSRWERRGGAAVPMDPGQERVLHVLQQHVDSGNATATAQKIAAALLIGGGLLAMFYALKLHFEENG